MKKIIYFFFGLLSLFSFTNATNYEISFGNAIGTTVSNANPSVLEFTPSQDMTIMTGYIVSTGLHMANPRLVVYRGTSQSSLNQIDFKTLTLNNSGQFAINLAVQSGYNYVFVLKNNGATWLHKYTTFILPADKYLHFFGSFATEATYSTTFSMFPGITSASSNATEWLKISYSYTPQTFVNTDALIYYNTSETLSTSGVITLDSRYNFNLFEDAPGLYSFDVDCPIGTGNTIINNGLPVAYTGNNINISGNYNVFISGDVLYIQDFVSTGSSFTGYGLTLFTGQTVVGTGDSNVATISVYQTIVDLFWSNSSNFIMVFGVIIFVVVLLLFATLGFKKKRLNKYGIDE